MLAELKQAHEALLACIAELEKLTRDKKPDPERLASVRWRLSRSSARRRKLVETACDLLMADPRTIDKARVEALRQESAATVSASSRHVGRWTMANILDDWSGYCEASAEMREAMRNRIAREQYALYPLLERAAA